MFNFLDPVQSFWKCLCPSSYNFSPKFNCSVFSKNVFSMYFSFIYLLLRHLFAIGLTKLPKLKSKNEDPLSKLIKYLDNIFSSHIKFDIIILYNSAICFHNTLYGSTIHNDNFSSISSNLFIAWFPKQSGKIIKSRFSLLLSVF